MPEDELGLSLCKRISPKKNKITMSSLIFKEKIGNVIFFLYNKFTQ